MKTGIEFFEGECRCCETELSPDFVRLVRSGHRNINKQCARKASYLIDGSPFCKIHAGITILNELVEK